MKRRERVYALLERSPDMTPEEIADAMNCSRNAIHCALRNLRRVGCVESFGPNRWWRRYRIVPEAIPYTDMRGHTLAQARNLVAANEKRRTKAAGTSCLLAELWSVSMDKRRTNATLDTLVLELCPQYSQAAD